ncbi:MAG: transglycosylase SLT domain-containing protein [Desulfovibrionaceae bacterium]|nr:transglycosylase SLT domain-containing protein [Desulfovibrionaceae bacterium]
MNCCGIKIIAERSWGYVVLLCIIKFLGAVLEAFSYILGALLALYIFCAVAKAGEITIPRAAEQHKAVLTRAARDYWGLNAPVSVFAAQVHTESGWDSGATSPVGAQGLAQFMPATAKWLPSVMPGTGKPAPFNPGWALRALCAYDRWLWGRTDGANDYERMAFVLSAYNGGLGWVIRDKARASALGMDASRWFGHVENVNAGRNRAAFAENRQYPRRILERQSAYIKAGWGPGIDAGGLPWK